MQKTGQKVSDIYEYVYHYTNFQGLRGILNSQTLWASNFRYVNDETELKIFGEMLFQIIYPLIEKECKNTSDQKVKDLLNALGIEQTVSLIIKDFLDKNHRAIGDELYITSFYGNYKNDKYVEENGLLSQWRGYGADGGFAIEFKTETLEQTFAEQEYFAFQSFSDVIYSNEIEKFNFEFSEELPHIFKFLTDNLKQGFDFQGNDYEILFKGHNSYKNCIGRVKHHSFKEEDEIRIISQPARKGGEYFLKDGTPQIFTKEKTKKVFQRKNGAIVPYIELFDATENLPITRIIVGPHKEKFKRKSALEKFVESSIKINSSDIPYIG